MDLRQLKVAYIQDSTLNKQKVNVSLSTDIIIIKFNVK
jgi:hypothetical protein